jgi:hypothetical protein
MLKKENIRNVVDAARLNLRTINISVKIIQVKMAFIVFVNAAETKRRNELGQSRLKNTCQKFYFTERRLLYGCRG